jgi:hypothetical protein
LADGERYEILSSFFIQGAGCVLFGNCCVAIGNFRIGISQYASSLLARTGGKRSKTGMPLPTVEIMSEKRGNAARIYKKMLPDTTTTSSSPPASAKQQF